MRISLIAAVAENGCIGRDGGLPWRLPADFKRFKALTMGHAIVMGRKTYESIGHPLPGRRSIVVSRGNDFPWLTEFPPPNLLVASLDDALEATAEDDEIFILGGAQIYEIALPKADRMYLTRVHVRVDGDTFFPPWDPDHWQLVEAHAHEPDDAHALSYTFQIYDRAV